MMKQTCSKYVHGMSSNTVRGMSVVFFITLTASSCPRPDQFNCVEAGQDPLTGRVYTKVSGTSTSLDMVGLKNNSLLTGLAANTLNNVTFQIVDATSGGTCTALPTLSTITTNINFPAGNARLAYAFNVPNVAIKEARCRITHVDVGTSCSSDSFSIRPPSFNNVTSVANADNAGTNANAGSVGAGNLIKAGANFSMSVATGVPGYNGTPTLDLTNKIQAHTGAIQTGTLAGNFSPAVSGTGTSTGNAFTYSEVGYFRLLSGAIKDITFTSADSANGGCIANSSSNTPVGGKVGCDIVTTANTSYFGRFIPNGFKATPVSVTEGCDAGNFTYFGGQLTSQFTLEAVNASNVRTQNYTGNYAKFKNIVPATLATYATTFSSYGVPNVTVANPASTLKFLASGSPTVVSDWMNGVATIRLGLQTKTVNPNPLLPDLDRPSNPTLVQSVNIPVMPNDGEAITTTATNIFNNTQFRYGRLNVANAYGAETMPLTFDVFAQYYDISGKWLTNTADTCTSILPNTFTATFPGGAGNNLTSAYQTNGWLANVGNFVGGKGKFKLRAPGHGNNGWLLLSTPVLPEFGAAQQMRASFGQYKSSLIYSREN